MNLNSFVTYVHKCKVKANVRHEELSLVRVNPIDYKKLNNEHVAKIHFDSISGITKVFGIEVQPSETTNEGFIECYMEIK